MKKALTKVNCDFCQKPISKSNIKKHEEYCYLNPKNLRECEVCFNPIKNYKTSQTCSYSCANTLFRTGPNNGNWNPDRYCSTCFYHHKKECIICGEKNIVEVHHLDENSNNNNPENLIPLCPTHHRYWHSSYQYLIYDQVMKYIKNWSE